MLKRVLLIDDDELDNYVHQRVLKKSGLVEEIVTFQYAADALEYLRSDQSADIIFLDVNMPRMNGFAFLHEYEQLKLTAGKRAAIVMLSTSNDQIDHGNAQKYRSVIRFDTKPLTVDMIGELVQEVNS